jgi:hypothetical protein
VTSTDCIMVLPDGRFHLERRKQVAPNPTSSLNIYESSLDSTQFQQLLNIVKKESITKLPDYAPPAFPMAVPWFSTVNAKVAQAGHIRTVGYWLWRGGGLMILLIRHLTTSRRYGRTRRLRYSRWSSGFTGLKPRSCPRQTQSPRSARLMEI